MELTLPDIQQFTPFSDLDAHHFYWLLPRIEVIQAKKGEKIIRRGSNEDYSYFLLNGTLLMISEDQRIRHFEAQSHASKTPIAELRPRRYDVFAASEILYIKASNIDIRHIQQGTEPVTTLRADDHESLEGAISYTIYHDLKNDQLKLTTLPSIAERIRKVIDRKKITSESLEEIIQYDPIMTIKLLQMANSSFLREGVGPARTCHEVIKRIGVSDTRELVRINMSNELALFQSRETTLIKRMRQLHQHSIRVAAISAEIAHSGEWYQSDFARIAGLLHDIGSFALISYMDDFYHLVDSENDIDSILPGLRGQIGALIIKAWGLPNPLEEIALECEDWQRDPGKKPDYVDLILVAQLHSYLGTPKMRKLPPILNLPAFKKLQLGRSPAEVSETILNGSEDRILRCEALLNS